MSADVGRLHLPRVADGPMGGIAARGTETTDDWSEIEQMLAGPAASREGPRGRARRRQMSPVILSSLVAALAFGGLLTAVLWGLPSSCALRPDGCPAPAMQAAAAPTSPGKHVVPPPRVADAGAIQPDVAAPLVQGRSVSEEAKPNAGTPDAAPAAVDPAAADAGPTYRRHHHHHHHWQ